VRRRERELEPVIDDRHRELEPGDREHGRQHCDERRLAEVLDHDLPATCPERLAQTDLAGPRRGARHREIHEVQAGRPELEPAEHQQESAHRKTADEEQHVVRALDRERPIGRASKAIFAAGVLATCDEVR
jgi:hypothetical protein